MRLWGQIYRDGQRTADEIAAVDIKKRSELSLHEETVMQTLTQLAHELDLERPVVVKKHLHDLYTYGRTVFRPQDFVESVAFDRFVVEVIPDEN